MPELGSQFLSSQDLDRFLHDTAIRLVSSNEKSLIIFSGPQYREPLRLLLSAVKYNRQSPCSLRFCVIYNP